MWRKIWILSIATLALFFPQRAGAAPDPRQDPVRVTVSVFNDAQVPPSVLLAAEARAETVFASAGVSLTWLDCGTPLNWHSELGCLDLAFPSHLSVRLVTGPRSGSGDIFGQSFLDEHGKGNYANVYLTPLSTAKALDVVREGDLVGYVVAHELGHLLLGKNSHSTEGLMRAKWEVSELHEAARGNLLFTKSERERIRVRYFSALARTEGASSKLTRSGR